MGSLCDREVACSASDIQGLNFEFCVWRAMSSHSSHRPQEVLLAQFSLCVHKNGLSPIHFIFSHSKGGRCGLIHSFVCFQSRSRRLLHFFFFGGGGESTCFNMAMIENDLDLRVQKNILTTYPATMSHWAHVSLLLGQRRRWWSNSKPALGQRLMLAEWRLTS